MKTKLVYISVIFSIILLSNSCNLGTKKETEKARTAKQVFEFTNKEGVAKNGMPLDSTISYFPAGIFCDSVKYYIGKDGEFITSHNMTKEEFSSISKTPVDEIRDTLKIEEDSLGWAEALSFMFFKMEEPILCNHYLEKDIYRATIVFPYHEPLSIRMEKGVDTISIYTTELNSSITNPNLLNKGKLTTSTPPTYTPPITRRDSMEYQNRRQQSIKNLLQEREYKNKDHNISSSGHKELSFDRWNTIEAMVDSSQFWHTKSDLFLKNKSWEGDATLILEGHTKEGYQIKAYQIKAYEIESCQTNRTTSSVVGQRKYFHFIYKYNRNNYYDRIFNMMLEYSDTDTLIEFR